MAKKTKFEMSQAAHQRLFNKHIVKSVGDPVSDFKSEYHNDVLAIQRKSGKILPKNERRILYSYNEERVLGKTKKRVSRNDYLNVFRKHKVESR